jgi:hypothetical protein
LRIWAIGLPIGAVLGGSLLGAKFGAHALAAAPLKRKNAQPLSVVALVVTIFATMPSIRVLVEAAQNGGAIALN